MSKIDYQKNIAKEVLHKLEIIDPSCILAGGAPRNWFFNKEANDLDFYIHGKFNEQRWKTDIRFERLGLDVKHVSFKSEKWKDYGIMEHLFRIYEGTYKEQKIQIMVMKESTYHSVVDCFGVSICKFWWKGGKVTPTNEALVSILSETLFIKDDYSAKEVHVEKQKRYFPDYKVAPYSKYDEAKFLTLEEYSDLGNYGTISYSNRLLKLVMEKINGKI